MSIADLIAGTHVEVVGLEDDPSGDLRVYLTHRARGLYVRVQDDDAKTEFRRAFGGMSRVLIATPPPECVFKEGED